MSVLLKKAFLSALAGACLCVAGEEDNVIWWMLADPGVKGVHGELDLYSIGDLSVVTDDGTKHVNSARVSVNRWQTGEDGARTLSNVDYLLLRDFTGEGFVSTYYDLPDPDGDWWAGPAYANVSGYVADASLVFMVELGNQSETGWMAMAVSEALTLAELNEHGFVTAGALGYHGHAFWSGGAYVVPEPSSGLLLLVGAGLLSLRRRRRAV